MRKYCSPSQFHRVKELFNQTLLNLTLWMAIASFSFQIATDTDIEAMRWFSEAFGMNIQDAVLVGLRWAAITGFGIFFAVACSMILYLGVSWFVMNFARLVKGKKGRRDKSAKQKQYDRFESVL